MRKIFTIIFTALLAITSCNDPIEEQKQHELNQNLTFTLEVASVSEDMAKIRVSHNGVKEDTWYGFVTDDVRSNDAKLIGKKIEELIAGNLAEELNTTAATTVTLRDLTPQTNTSTSHSVFLKAEKSTDSAALSSSRQARARSR